MDEQEFRGQDIGAGVSVIIVQTDAGGGPRLHRHAYREVFVIVEGESTFTMDGTEEVHQAGDVVVAPAGVAHTFTNSGRGRLVQVDIHESPQFETEWLE